MKIHTCKPETDKQNKKSVRQFRIRINNKKQLSKS